MMNCKNILFILSTIFLFSCTQKDKDGKELSTTTSGTVQIVVDETLMPIVDSEEQVFETIYPKANLEITYLPEAEAIARFINDSAQLIILPRELSEQEKAIFKERKLSTPRANKIATDAIALIINKNNVDTTLDISQVREIIRGKIQNWKQLDAKSNLTDINIVFDNQNSSTVKYMIDLVGQKDIKGYALKTNKEVITYVGQNKNAMGIIGINWISDLDDSSTTFFKQNINVVGIKEDATEEGDDYFYQPYQAYLATKQYALIRSVYTIIREPRAGLATGFASFIAGDKGQRIILKSGLLPANAPIRIISTE
jgi:phosphate transport system substrate-binding protein